MSRPPPPKLGKPKSQASKQKEEAPKQKRGDGEDLTTILDKEERAQLTLLIADATESMRKLVVDNFTANAGLNQGLIKDGMTEDEKLMSSNIDPGTADVSAFEKERKLKERFQKELATPKMQLLKKTSLKAFDEWRESVLERVGEVANSKQDATRQKAEVSASQTQPAAPVHKSSGTIVKSPTAPSKIKFKDLYPPTKTALTKLSMSERALVVHSILLLLISLKHYNAPSRVLLLNLTSSLKLPLKVFEEHEAKIAKGLLEAAKQLSADEETKKKAEENKDSRKWRVGLATAAGAAIIGVTGGMAAPLVAAGVGSVMSGLGLGATAAAGYLGSVAGSTMLVGGLFGAYGGRMTGQIMDQYARDVEDFAFEPVHGTEKTTEDEKEAPKQASDHDHKLRVTICITGWLTEKEEVVAPWKVLGTGAEVFALRWELEALLNLGNAMDGLASSAAWGYAQKELIKRTIFADMMAAMWPLALVKVARVIDNPFSVAMGRADKTGEILADALVNRAQGERPVTLVGYSIGARVIYTCLHSLAKRRAFGLVESVVMMGAPTPSDANEWRIMRSVVSGRMVNVYSENDYVLGFMYRAHSVQYGIAGLMKIEGLPSVENFDVSEDVSGHTRYRYLIGSILNKLAFEDIDSEAIVKEQEALEALIEKEKEQSLSKQKSRLLARRESQVAQGGEKEDGKQAEKDAEAEDADAEADEIQKDIEQKTQKSMTQWALEKFYITGPSTDDAKNAAGKARDAYKAPSKAQSDATAAVKAEPGNASNDAKKVYNDPTGAAKETARTYVAPKLDYAKSAASYLPGFGGGNKPSTDTAAAGEQTAKKQEPTKAEAQTPQAVDKKSAAPQQSYTSYAASYLPGIPNLGGKPSTDSPGPPVNKTPTRKASTPAAEKKTPANTDPTPSPPQSYTSYAASYMPGLPSFRRGTAASAAKGTDSPKSPAPDRRPSSAQKPATIDRTKSGNQTPQSARRPSDVKSPSISRRGSEMKSPTPGSRKGSEIRSPPSSVSRTQSEVGAKSPSVSRQASETKSSSMSRTASEAKPDPTQRRSSAAMRSSKPALDGK